MKKIQYYYTKGNIPSHCPAIIRNIDGQSVKFWIFSSSTNKWTEPYKASGDEYIRFIPKPKIITIEKAEEILFLDAI